MSGKRQKSQQQMAFRFDGTGEACLVAWEGTGTLAAEREPENPADGRQLMEEICERENLSKALKRVQANEGSPGIDGMTVDELPGYLNEHWPVIWEQLMSGTYKPQPVKRVEIPKPDGLRFSAGVRKLGIPTVLDRYIQQAVQQVLQQRWDP
ncbi:MAG: group II intron reverse transcriptase/maturase, partial [Acidobacteriota bacterium]|nr:group II intron reverse transcriptase/maturase [Acidobacteriota bacterium]